MQITSSIQIPVRHVTAKADILVDIQDDGSFFSTHKTVSFERMERVWIGSNEITKASHSDLWSMVQDSFEGMSIDPEEL
jgi:hypothetical protein